MYGEILLVKAAFCCIVIMTKSLHNIKKLYFFIYWGFAYHLGESVLHVNNDNSKKNNDNCSKNNGADGCKYGECVMIVIDYFGFIKGNLKRPSIALKNRSIFKIRISPSYSIILLNLFYRNGRIKTTQTQVYIRSWRHYWRDHWLEQSGGNNCCHSDKQTTLPQRYLDRLL